MASIGSAWGHLSDRTLRPLKDLARSLGLRGGETPSEPAVDAATERPWSPAPDASTQVMFLPREPRWAYVCWSISSLDRERAVAAGARSLCLRLGDVTGIGADQRPHALQEIVVEPQAVEWFLPIPVANRDYRVELGYRTRSGWFSLAFSQIARMPAESPSEQIADRFIPFQIDAALPAVLEAIPAAPVGQHERLYQQAMRRVWRHGSEVFLEEGSEHEGQARHRLSDSGAGPWASGRNASGAGGVFRQRSFWLVADAQLIVYGATEPDATLTIAGEQVPLEADGSFRLQVPFHDGQLRFPIEATAADGDQKRSIALEFERRTPANHTNRQDEATVEWF